MKHALTIAAALLLAAPASAKTVYLQCAVTERTYEVGFKHRGSYRKETEKEDYAVDISFNLETQTGVNEGTPMSVTATPTEIRLRSVTKDLTDRGSELTRTNVINRKTLAFKGKYLKLGGRLGIYNSETKGTCKKVEAPAGNQI